MENEKLEPLSVLIDQLKIARNGYDQATAEMKKAMEEFVNSPSYSKLKVRQEHFQAAKEAVEGRIRKAGQIAYESTNDKHPCPGVNVKIFKKYQISDPKAVRGWCIKNYPLGLKIDAAKADDVRALLMKSMPMALVVDNAMVIKHASTGGTVPGIIVIDDPQVQIDSKLGE